MISVVSHGHADKVQQLLNDIASFSFQSVSRVILTINRPEPEPQAPEGGWPFILQIQHNKRPLGFGANHNRALSDATEAFVCVLNPDVRWSGVDPLPYLVKALQITGAGCSYPLQIDNAGFSQESERTVPTPSALLRRRLFGFKELSRVDWVNAACIALPLAVWRQLDGFDERYFMYCEDVDFCLRLRLLGFKLVRAPVRVIHAGERASSYSLAHFAWHLRSLLRLWRSPVYRRAIQFLTLASTSNGTIGTQ